MIIIIINGIRLHKPLENSVDEPSNEKVVIDK